MIEEITEEKKISLIKRAISSAEGWRVLAGTIRNAIDPLLARERCETMLRKIAGDKTVTISTSDGPLPGDLGDLLVTQLDQHLATYDVTKEEK